MSKSYKNFIGINDKPNDKFVKLMEIKDDLIIKYFEHCTTFTLDQNKPYEERLNSGENPKNIKIWKQLKTKTHMDILILYST